MAFTQEQIQRQASLTPEQAKTESGIPVVDINSFQKANPALTFDQQDRKAYFDAGNNATPAVTQTTPITSDTLKTEPALTVPQATPSTTSAAIDAKSQSIVTNLQNQLAQDQANKSNQVTEQKGKVQSLIDTITGKQTDRANAEGDVNTPGTPAFLKELARKGADAINVSIQAKTNELAALNNQLLSPEQKNTEINNINNKYALEQANLQLSYHLAQSDYTAVEDTLNTKLELELAPLKMNLDFQTGIYNQLAGSLTASEEREWKNLIDTTNFQIQKTEQDKTAVNTALTNALANGANIPASLSVKLSNAKNLEEFNQISIQNGVSLQNPIDNQIKQANLNNIYSQIAERNATTGSNVDPAQAVAYAQQYASTGTIPTGLPKGTFGIVSQIAKELPKSPGQIIDKATGVTPDKLGAAGDAYSSLYSAIELAGQLKELDTKRIGGITSGTVGKIFGSADQQRYIDLKNQITDLLGRARSGAALNAAEESRYSGMLPGRFSEPLGLGSQSGDRIDNFISALSSDLKNKADSKGWVINGLSTVNIEGKTYKVGDVISNGSSTGRVNADGSITLISQ